MNRLGRLALVTATTTYVLVVIGAIVRGTGSGMGCPDWPQCYGQWLPPLGDNAAWIEWTHRGVAAIVGLLVLAVAFVAVRRHRASRSIVLAAVAAVVLTGVQAWLGKITVDTGNAGEWVTAHLATAMLLLALLTFIFIRSRYPDALPARGQSQRLTLLLAFTAASVYALILFGAHVTASGASLVFPDWPLFRGQLLPTFSETPSRAALEMTHFLHRFVAAVVGVIVVVAAWAAWRAVRADRVERESGAGQRVLGLIGSAAALYGVQVVVGALQIWTSLASWAVALHLALGAAIWALVFAAALVSYFEARTARVAVDRADGPATDASRTGERGDRGRGGTLRERVGAYVALTKPRIIELLLVTTVPAMVLAARGLPPLDLVLWTLLGGTLAAGGANAINCYLDRDIDELMTRTRRRPLPAHAVEPENALVFGLALGVLSFAVMAFLVNLVAAFLTLVALAFYVVVYTLLLKRTTPQNIVLGGAAGALPPVIGWAAVTGDITLPALLLFAIVFYWTPPHFWALSLRLRRDYEAAGVPMLPVTHGVPETTRQIALYTILMVALTLAFFAAARMGLLFLGGTLVLGGLFLMQAFAMWREGTDRRAVRLYRYSITYLTALFGLIVLDVFLYLPL
ncbi:MAG TPA: heme o synthase [Candidatus Caenarcaniphilales bacterium]|nr:heme o synthase [Candidatus Caenarcaniphilales bacterium]